MKKVIFTVLSIFNSNLTFCQSITLQPNVSSNSLIVLKEKLNNSDGGSFNHATEDNLNNLYLDYSFEGAYFYCQSGNKPLLFTTNNGGIKLRIDGNNGNFAVGSHVPTANLHVGNFTKLGQNAPAIKTKKFTSLTDSVQNGLTLVPHGISFTKILSYHIVVDLGPAGNVFEDYTQTSGYEVGLYVDSTFIYVLTKPGNSINILKKPFKILITYEE
jgi:hypothetical protein